LACREDAKQNVQIVGLCETPVADVEQILRLIGQGLRERTSGQTGANSDSSRSHAILQMQLKNVDTAKRHGMISFIDLAGSERGADV
jgi:kinesin family protein 2/24